MTYEPGRGIWLTIYGSDGGWTARLRLLINLILNRHHLLNNAPVDEQLAVQDFDLLLVRRDVVVGVGNDCLDIGGRPAEPFINVALEVDVAGGEDVNDALAAVTAMSLGKGKSQRRVSGLVRTDFS